MLEVVEVKRKGRESSEAESLAIRPGAGHATKLLCNSSQGQVEAVCQW